MMTEGEPASLESAVAAQKKFTEDLRKRYLHDLEVKFKESRNPLLAWQAICSCLPSDSALPNWVQNYLFESSHKILSVTHETRPSRTSEAVSTALGFLGSRGRGSVFSQAAKDEQDHMLHSMVVWCDPTPPKEWLAIETVARETGLSKSTVRLAFKRGVAEQWHVDELTEWELKSI